MKPTKSDLTLALRSLHPAIVVQPYGRGLTVQVPRTIQREAEQVCISRGLHISSSTDPGVGDVVTFDVFGFPRRSRHATAPIAGALVFEARYSDGDGHLIVPANIVRALKLAGGAVLQARVERGRLVAWLEPGESGGGA